MTSILTNISAMAALHTLRGINSGMGETQAQVASGLRIQAADDNAAYWSISTTMRSDNKAISAVADALGFSSAKLDVTSSGLENIVDLLSEYKARIVAAMEPGVDRSKVQKELDQLYGQMESVVESASFNGVNWLKSAQPDNLWAVSDFKSEMVASFARSANGSVDIKTIDLDLAGISALNTGGGGILQKDIRSLGTIGGFRPTDFTTYSHQGHQDHGFTGPATFGAADEVRFDITVDEGVFSGGVKQTIVIDRTLIDAALGTADGKINTVDQMRSVLEKAFVDNGVPATAFSYIGISLGENRFEIASLETSGHHGSSIIIDNVTSTFTGNYALGLESTSHVIDHDNMYPSWKFGFDGPFQVHNLAEFSFELSMGGALSTTVTVDRTIVDAALGTSDGIVSSAADLAAILTRAGQGRGLVANATANMIELTADQTMYPDAGTKAPTLTVTNVRDNIGWVVDFDLKDVNIVNPQANLDHYLDGLEDMLKKATTAAATLGSLQMRVDMQSNFARTLMDTIDKGVGRLVDADMNEASTRLKAQQSQQQLAVQALSIANSNADNVLQLFR